MPALNSIGCLIEAAELAPGKPAIVEGGRSVTFGELYQRVRQLAKGFIAAGFKHGERFAIWAPNSIDWEVAALAGHMVGCALVPLNTRYKGGEVEDILNRSACRGIFYSAEFLGVRYADMLASMDAPGLRHRVDLDALSEWMPTARTVGDAELQERAVRVGPDTLADVLYTSGTTGAPKGVMCSHGQNIRVFATWSRSVALGEHDEYLVINPYFHSFGYKAGWLAALINRVTVHPVPVFDLDECLRLIEARRISFLPGPPTVFRSLLDHPERGRYDLGSLRCAVTGAASVPVQLVRDMKHLLGFAAVYTAYGLTESTGVVSICKPGDDFETIATTCGRPMDDIEVMIADTDGSPQPAGALGEIWVRGYNVMQGYLDDAKATAEAITEDGWLKTGDIGLMTESHYLRVTGRVKDMYICGGFNCYPAEIENILLGHPDIADIAVVGVPDARMGEVGHAHVVPRFAHAADAQNIIAWARENMANYKAPRFVTFVEELPRNASGKVQKFKLLEGRH